MNDPYPCERVLKHCFPIIKVVKSWKDTPLANLNENSKLPKTTQNFIGLIENYTGAKVVSFGNGPETQNLVYIKKE